MLLGTPFQWDSSRWAGFSEGNVKPWLPVHPNYKDINLKLQRNFVRSTFEFYKQLSELRRDDTFVYGSYQSKAYNDNVFAYSRAMKDHNTYVVLINLGPREEIIDVTQLASDFSDDSHVVIAGADSYYSSG